MASDDVWHLVEARREDGAPALFRIRDVAPRADQPRIFVVELPYPVTGLGRMPDAAGHRRLAQFEEQWVAPATAALDWTFVAVKTDDGSFFLYLYGSGDPQTLIGRLAPFDGALGFFDEHDPTWDEYAALRELLAQADALGPAPEPEPEPRPKKPTKTKPKPKPPKAKPKPRPTTKKIKRPGKPAPKKKR